MADVHAAALGGPGDDPLLAGFDHGSFDFLAGLEGFDFDAHATLDGGSGGGGSVDFSLAALALPIPDDLAFALEPRELALDLVPRRVPSAAGSVASRADGRLRRGERPRRFSKNGCQADGCGADLAAASFYCRRNHICGDHLKAPDFTVQGVHSRYCQRCGLSHALDEFDPGRKSCRAALVKVSERRRKKAAGGGGGGGAVGGEPAGPGPAEADETSAVEAMAAEAAAAASASATSFPLPPLPPHALFPLLPSGLPPAPHAAALPASAPAPAPAPAPASALLAAAAQMLVSAASGSSSATAGAPPVSVPVQLQLPPGLTAEHLAALASGEWVLAPRSALAPAPPPPPAPSDS
jgi:hypothetical protein